MAVYFDRYNNFRVSNSMKLVPGIKIPALSGDKKIVYKVGDTRLDKVSDTYYSSPYYGWLIMLANPEFGGLEFNIPDQSIIRIPFPFELAINSYITQINQYNTLYG